MSIAPLPPDSTKLYKNAPAVEVVYSIRTALAQPVDVERFLAIIKEHFPDDFVQHELIQNVQGNVTVKQDGKPDGQLRFNAAGYRATNADGTFVAHYLQQGLILNFLPPYPGYAAAMAKLRSHWEVYRKVVGEVPMTALSLRYIDRIDIPRHDATSFDLDQYFTIVSKIPEGLSAHHCYQQYWFNKGNEDIRARVIWSSLDNLPDHFSFALDTEAMLDPANIGDAKEAWARFDELHAWCWHVFDHSLTDECKKLFQ